MNPDPGHHGIAPECRLLLFTFQTFMQKWVYHMPVAANLIFLANMQMHDIERLATGPNKNIKDCARHRNKSYYRIDRRHLHHWIEFGTRNPDLFGLMNGITGQYKT